MTFILKWIGGAAGPYLMLAVAAVILALAGWGGVQTLRLAELHSAFDKHLLADRDAENEATARARQLEQDHAAVIADADRKHQEDLQHEHDEADRILAAERDGTLKLRQRFQSCEAQHRAAPTATAGGSDAEARSGLQEADVGFLVRIADEADGIVRQLDLAQTVIAEQRATCNAMH